MNARKFRSAITGGATKNLIVGLLLSGSLGLAATPIKLSGALSGSVRDVAGVPQMGASVLLFNHYDKLVQTALTNAGGTFAFDALAADTYSVRVTLASFVPALKRNIAVQPGMQSVLAINLASFLSSIELVSTGPRSGTLMNDDWKWVLRSSMATRPVLRALPHVDIRVDISDPDDRQKSASVFSDTRGVVKVSSGETTPFTDLGNQPDLGTAFALSTSLYGANQLQFTGNVGYAMNSAVPATGFRTSYSRTDVSGPEVKLTMQQVSLPRTGGFLGSQQQENLPALRTMSLAMIDRIDINDNIDLDYGVSLDSVTFVSRLNYLSPFARLNYRLGRNGTASVGYSSGAPPMELLNSRDDRDASLQQDMAALGLLPRISIRQGRQHIQRTQNVEFGYNVKIGSRTYSVGVYREAVSNAALTMSAPANFYDSGELLPELSSRSSVFNVGGYKQTGYTASVQQAVGDDFTITVAYGSGSVLRTEGRRLQTDDPDELRRMIRPSQQQWAVGRISGVVPGTGTRIVSSYEWTDYRSLTPGHVYLTQSVYPEAGLNLRVRQPMPAFCGLPGRLEATAEFRNVLAQGYLPITTAEGQNLLLTHSPRAVRGGVSFIF